MLSREEIESIVDGLPGGLNGFAKGWGYLHFAERVCRAALYSASGDRDPSDISAIADGVESVGNSAVAREASDILRRLAAMVFQAGMGTSDGPYYASGYVGALDMFKFLRDNCLDLRCVSVATGGGDRDVAWQVIGHHMAEPKERVIAQSHSDDPTEAVRMAMGVFTPKNEINFKPCDSLGTYRKANDDATRARDELIEALRRDIVANVIRYDFYSNMTSGVERAVSRAGAWVEFSEIHKRFDPTYIDSLIGARRADDKPHTVAARDHMALLREAMIAIEHSEDAKSHNVTLLSDIRAVLKESVNG